MMCILLAKRRVQEEVEARVIFQIVAITVLRNDSDVFFGLKGNVSDWNTKAPPQ